MTLHDKACSWYCGVFFNLKCILAYTTKSDASKIEALHKQVHDLSGCLGSLDVTKINCPVGWKSRIQGKEGYPIIGLEAVSDYNLWIWHSAFV